MAAATDGWWEPAEALGPVVSDLERAALERAGYRGTVGLGHRSALLVVDVTYAFCGPSPGLPLGEAVVTHPNASGRVAWEAVARIGELVALAREVGWPLVFTRPGDPGGVRWADKQQRGGDVPEDAHEVVPATGFVPGEDTLVDKPAPSAFFATDVAERLAALEVDGVVVCGGVTSGCVRATAVDAFSHGLRTTVVADATFDRLVVSHQVALFDLALKYADVCTTRELARTVRGG